MKKLAFLEDGFSLFDHQRETLEWIQRKEESEMKGGIVSLEMGMGKTLIALSTVYLTRERGPTLFLCNKSLLSTVAFDAQKFFGKRLKVLLLHRGVYGDPVLLCQSVMNEHDVVLMTYDTLVGLDKKKSLAELRWHRIVADESQRFSNKKTRLYKTLEKLNAPCRLCLTGTPIKNYESDLHAQLLFCGLDPTIKWSYQTYTQLKLSRHVFLMSFADTDVKLPEATHTTVSVEFTPDERSLYDIELAKTVAAFAGWKKKEVKFANVLVQYTRMRQACLSGQLLFPENEHISSKFRALEGVFKDIPADEKVVIFSSFATALTLLMALMPEGAVFIDGKVSMKAREARLNRFRTDPKCKWLFMTLKTGSVGLNLTEANNVVLMEPWWNAPASDQAIARVLRIGQKRPVRVWRLIVKKSIEEKMVSICNDKEDMADDYMEQVRVLLGRESPPSSASAASSSS